jgi:hypothetical protein
MNQPMDSSKQDTLQEFKECAGRGCSNPAIHKLEILYIKKIGWFCGFCKCSLVADGLVQELDNTPTS